jgi:Rod binding domain-containing protein
MNVSHLATDLAPTGLSRDNKAEAPNDPDKIAKAAQQFEGVLLRQILSESMKPLLENGAGGQVYGYFLTTSLAESIGKSGGLGLGHVLQAQLSKGKHDH